MRTVFVVAMVLLLLVGTAGAETTSGWVMCQPDSEVNIREKPSKKSPVVAHRYMGDEITLDGQRSGEWIHCIVPCEYEEGWIREDFLSLDEPIPVGSGKYEITKNKTWSRYSMSGNRRRILNKGFRVTVYLMTDEWSVTSQGFIKTELLQEVAENAE